MIEDKKLIKILLEQIPKHGLWEHTIENNFGHTKYDILLYDNENNIQCDVRIVPSHLVIKCKKFYHIDSYITIKTSHVGEFNNYVYIVLKLDTYRKFAEHAGLLKLLINESFRMTYDRETLILKGLSVEEYLQKLTSYVKEDNEELNTCDI